MATLASKALRDSKVRQVYKDLQAVGASLDPRGGLVPQAARELQDLVVSVEPLERLDSKVFLDDPDIKVSLVSQDLPEKLDSRVSRAHLDLPVTMAILDPRALLDLPAKLGRPELGASADFREKADSKEFVVPLEREALEVHLVIPERLAPLDPPDLVVTPGPLVALVWAEREEFPAELDLVAHLDPLEEAAVTGSRDPLVSQDPPDSPAYPAPPASSPPRATEDPPARRASRDPVEPPVDLDLPALKDRKGTLACPVFLVSREAVERPALRDREVTVEREAILVNKGKLVNPADPEWMDRRVNRVTLDWQGPLGSLGNLVFPDLLASVVPLDLSDNLVLRDLRANAVPLGR